MVLNPSVIDWRSTWDMRGDSGVSVGVLLDRLARHADASAWHELEDRLLVEGECCCSAGFAALPELARLAQSGTNEHRERALDLAALIVRTLHRYVHRTPLTPATPEDLTGIARWVHSVATEGGDATLADGLTYLFGLATCGICGSRFELADWIEAENSPGQPIDPIVPRTNAEHELETDG
ncbi:hypothetical protein ACTMTJ_09870 [Phytohabitans sp. LJ34]|uniref:hypothetical protein n=1 Tax=Phytohabitans sp. LJ34 TaxID=3452217 RepID=UPI003F894659